MIDFERLASRLSRLVGDTDRRVPRAVVWAVLALLVFMTVWGFLRSIA